MALLPDLNCPIPSCGKRMTNTSVANKQADRAFNYGDCLRKCTTCKVAYSNGRSKPTLIHEDPLGNIPAPVHSGALATLGGAMNIRNRVPKLAKFGFETSEDALTWTVFSFVNSLTPATQRAIYQEVFGIKAAIAPAQAPACLFWGVPVPASPRGVAAAQKLIAISNALDKNRNSRSEPDIVLDFGLAGVVFIEVKYRSGNSGTRTPSKFDRYVNGTAAFTDPAIVRASGLYELARNWRFAHDLADGRPFVLANLTLEGPQTVTKGLPRFRKGLNHSATPGFLQPSWRDVLAAIVRATGPLPPWLHTYCRLRGL